jgi:UV DNA damage endonuclease
MLGVCCQWLNVVPTKSGEKYVNALGERALQLGRYSSGAYTPEHISEVWLGNVGGVARMIPIMRSAGVGMFRIGSTLLPLFDKIAESPLNNLVADAESAISKVGAAAAGMRLTTHPGQFVVISSDSDTVVANSIRELEYHAFVMDSLGCAKTPQFAINIHGGKRGAFDRLVAGINALPPAVRSRLTLENDENCWSVTDLLPVAEKTGIPIVFDSHHHAFNDGGLSGEAAMLAAAGTWPSGIKPLQHLSNTEPGMEGGSFTERRQHSWAIHYIPDYQKAFYVAGKCDIEMECKGKNLGFIPYLDALGIHL